MTHYGPPSDGVTTPPRDGHSTETAQVRALTVRDLRERLADLPDSTEVWVETIVGGDLVHDDTALMDLRLVTTADGYYLRLVLDPADPYGTRELIDHALASRELSTTPGKTGDA